MIKSIDDTIFNMKRVLIRVDFNVPLDENFKVTDDTRIVESLPTIDKIIDDCGVPILMSHLGRPNGEVKKKYSLEPVAEHIRNKFGYTLHFASDCIGEKAKETIAQAEVGDIVLLENLRFHPEEEKNDMEFARKIASLGDAYVNDAFGTAHRAHASTYAVAQCFTERYAGYLMMKEIEYLGKALSKPVRPFLAVLGGAKISGKIDVIRNLMDKCDKILIGGGMAFTFFKAMGYEIGNSLLEEDKIELASELLKLSREKGVDLVLPTDIIAANAFSNEAQIQTALTKAFPAGWFGLDIGPDSIKSFSELILSAKTTVWNGPMGVFEMENFAHGTFAIAQAMANATAKGAITVVGGGDSAAAIDKMNFKSRVTHVSTGGGASLEFLEGKELPGLKVLEV